MSPVNASLANRPHKRPSQPDVLVVEPDLDLLANRALLLCISNYSVVTANSYRDIFCLRGENGLRLAVLSETLGEFALRASAEFVRRQWPCTRILIFGTAQSSLEDQLYDEAVDHRCQPKELLDALARLSEDSWCLTSRLFGSRLGTSADARDRPAPYGSTLSESDPTKKPHGKLIEESQNTPASTQRIASGWPVDSLRGMRLTRPSS
jgi:hypothetical protein